MKSMQWLGRTGMVCLLGGLTFLWTGCTTVKVKTAKQRTLETGSALKSLPSLKVAVKDFTDVRGAPPDYAGRFQLLTIKLDKPAAVWVQETIRREFARNGHNCVVNDGSQQADVLVEGAVYELALSDYTGIVTSKIIAKAGVKISGTAARSPAKAFVRKYDGSYYGGSVGSPRAKIPKILDEALLNMAKEFTTDPELMTFLREVGAESSKQ